MFNILCKTILRVGQKQHDNRTESSLYIFFSILHQDFPGPCLHKKTNITRKKTGVVNPPGLKSAERPPRDLVKGSCKPYSTLAYWTDLLSLKTKRTKGEQRMCVTRWFFIYSVVGASCIWQSNVGKEFCNKLINKCLQYNVIAVLLKGPTKI